MGEALSRWPLQIWIWLQGVRRKSHSVVKNSSCGVVVQACGTGRKAASTVGSWNQHVWVELRDICHMHDKERPSILQPIVDVRHLSLFQRPWPTKTVFFVRLLCSANGVQMQSYSRSCSGWFISSYTSLHRLLFRSKPCVRCFRKRHTSLAQSKANLANLAQPLTYSTKPKQFLDCT